MIIDFIAHSGGLAAPASMRCMQVFESVGGGCLCRRKQTGPKGIHRGPADLESFGASSGKDTDYERPQKRHEQALRP